MDAPLAAVEAESMGRPPKDTVQITFRVPTSWLGEADQIAGMLARPGFEAGRTDGFRAAIARGFEVLRAELPVAALHAGRSRALSTDVTHPTHELASVIQQAASKRERRWWLLLTGEQLESVLDAAADATAVPSQLPGYEREACSEFLARPIGTDLDLRRALRADYRKAKTEAKRAAPAAALAAARARAKKGPNPRGPEWRLVDVEGGVDLGDFRVLTAADALEEWAQANGHATFAASGRPGVVAVQIVGRPGINSRARGTSHPDDVVLRLPSGELLGTTAEVVNAIRAERATTAKTKPKTKPAKK